jgi:hypothetical protein
MKKPTVVSDLLSQAEGMLQRLREGTASAERTLAAVRRVLPPELADAPWGAVLRDGRLTVLVRSAAWGTRIRYEAPRIRERLAAELGAPVEEIKVKVRGG